MPSESDEPDPVSAAVGRRVRQLRRERGMTQVQLSQATGLHQPFLSRIEAGQQNLELRTLARLAVALASTLEALVSGISLGGEPTGDPADGKPSQTGADEG